MSDPRIVAGNLFDRTVLDGQDEKSAFFLPLPLNLIALIISYVRNDTLRDNIGSTQADSMLIS